MAASHLECRVDDMQPVIAAWDIAAAIEGKVIREVLNVRRMLSEYVSNHDCRPSPRRK